MIQIIGEHEVCSCCALVIANGDESGCRDHYGHTHESCGLPLAALVSGATYRAVHEGVQCDGCQEWVIEVTQAVTLD